MLFVCCIFFQVFKQCFLTFFCEFSCGVQHVFASFMPGAHRNTFTGQRNTRITLLSKTVIVCEGVMRILLHESKDQKSNWFNNFSKRATLLRTFLYET